MCVLIASGCSKRQEPPATQGTHPTPTNGPLDLIELFRQELGEQAELLSVKYRLPRAKAEKVAWEYYKRHDLTYHVITRDENRTAAAKREEDLLRLREGAAATMGELAATFEINEEALAGFLADLRLFEAAQEAGGRDYR